MLIKIEHLHCKNSFSIYSYIIYLHEEGIHAIRNKGELDSSKKIKRLESYRYFEVNFLVSALVIDIFLCQILLCINKVLENCHKNRGDLLNLSKKYISRLFLCNFMRSNT